MEMRITFNFLILFIVLNIMINIFIMQREGDAWGKMLRSLRLKIAVVFSVLISMLFVILSTAMYQLQKEKEIRSLDQYSQNTVESLVEQFKVEE
ncbi:hypothetical protein COI75_09685 [Bacillus cereus]|nr:hypothetical protein CON38_06775 [Bacillus cereus]PFI24590.1 hypothetical protein COI75_09685 [Bacillus cereus]